MKEYKVLNQRDKWFAGRFDPERLEEALNAYARQGWRVVSCTTAKIPDILGERDEIIVLMERDRVVHQTPTAVLKPKVIPKV